MVATLDDIHGRTIAAKLWGLSNLTARALYGQLYKWLLMLALLDVALTSLILWLGGSEANAVPRIVIDAAGVPGMLALKAASIAAVLGVCEIVGRKRHATGRALAQLAIAANTAAVTLGCAALTVYGVTVFAG